MPHYVGIIQSSAKKHSKTVNKKYTSIAYFPGGKPPAECIFFDDAGAGFSGRTIHTLYRIKAQRVIEDDNEFIPS